MNLFKKIITTIYITLIIMLIAIMVYLACSYNHQSPNEIDDVTNLQDKIKYVSSENNDKDRKKEKLIKKINNKNNCQLQVNECRKIINKSEGQRNILEFEIETLKLKELENKNTSKSEQINKLKNKNQNKKTQLQTKGITIYNNLEIIQIENEISKLQDEEIEIVKQMEQIRIKIGKLENKNTIIDQKNIKLNY
ncbi:putative membrane protein [Candidatus Phytoplasma solani]|uniref:hypothetical protein n=1 Tax=Candidatus Phytoplasma solani TaxID=69896 RepID=UPI0032DA44B4